MNTSVLVVDNNPVLLKAVSTILLQEDCVVETAENGLQALQVLEDFHPDIVFTDLIMPQVSGEQLCNILRHTKKFLDIYIVVLSATVLEDSERILREIDCDYCIAKGDLKELREHLKDALGTFKNRKKNVFTSGMNARIPEGLQPSVVTSELLNEKNHLRKVLANLHEGIIELSKEGKVLNANNAALEILSVGEEVLVGAELQEICDWGEFTEQINRWVTGQLLNNGLGTFNVYEKNPLKLNGHILTASFIPVVENGETFGLCILGDITRQFLAEEHNRELDNAVRLIKKMDAMSLMAGGVAHDFNNLLTVICGNLDIVMLKGDRSSQGEKNKLIDQAKKAALVAVDLTRQISCFSNFGIVSREYIEIGKLVRDSVEDFFKDQTGCGYEIKSSYDECMVYADGTELDVVIDNVLQNCIEAIGRERTPSIKIEINSDEFMSRQLINGQYVPAGRYVRIDIIDSGKGIDKEHLFRIFDPYYSTKERGSMKGMGLGLTVVYATLRNHGGYIVVNSEQGVGTKVSLYLPELQKAPTRTDFEIGNPLSGQPVLLIDPDIQMGQIGTIMLEHLDLSVKSVETRGQAIEYLNTYQQENQTNPLPLVLLDLSERHGGAAEETCAMLHTIAPDLKIIAMSGGILDPVMEDCKKFGFCATLPKPYVMDTLKHIVTAAFYS